ncbi:MAG: SH3 domain-containing protein [Clostridia bacterium]|nr:SH3 domain-containing protein [Clostridia bacterium]
MKARFYKLIILVLVFVTITSISPNKLYAVNYSESLAGIVKTKNTGLNIRDSASVKGSVVGTLKKGSYVTLLSKKGSWWYVKYGDGRFGYCFDDYIQTVNSSKPGYVNTVSTGLNVRCDAGFSYSIISKLAKKEEFVVLSGSGGWYKILYDGTKVGYVSGTYVGLFSSSSSSSSSQADPISLIVPSYRQTDSRWEDVELGKSGKTIGRIGCLVTCMAMYETFRTGKTVYPDAMSKKLSFSKSGDMSWPDDITIDYSSSLKNIYNLLKSGKPVIVGAKKSSGGQHWVMVVGYNGGSITKSSSYLINDPATASRKTLSEFYSDYPKFYKIAYYK